MSRRLPSAPRHARHTPRPSCLPLLAAQAAAWREPAVLVGVAPTSFLLPALATGLQVPRAVWVGNHMWATGTAWATAFAALQAALVAALAGRLLLAALALCLPPAAATLVLHAHAAARGLPSPLAALRPIARAYGRERWVLRELWRMVARGFMLHL